MQKITAHKSGPSNLLVDRTKTMVKLINFVLVVVVKDNSVFESENGLTIYDQFYLI